MDTRLQFAAFRVISSVKHKPEDHSQNNVPSSIDRHRQSSVTPKIRGERESRSLLFWESERGARRIKALWFMANAPHHVCIPGEGDASQPVHFTFSEEPADAVVTTTTYFRLCSYVVIPMIPSAIAKAYKGQYSFGACRAIRHTLNPPLYFMETAIENIAGGLEIETHKRTSVQGLETFGKVL